MAATHFKFDPGTRGGGRLVGALSTSESGVTALVREYRTMEAMLTGAANQDASYAVIRSEYGFESDPLARAAFDALAASAGRLDTDASIDAMKTTLANTFRDLRN